MVKFDKHVENCPKYVISITSGIKYNKNNKNNLFVRTLFADRARVFYENKYIIF